MAVCTISTYNTIKDLKLFLFSLNLFNDPKPKVYLLCDNETAKEAKTYYSGEIVIIPNLDVYGNLNREQMSTRGGNKYHTLWEDFMMEKAKVIENALENEQSVFFCDADICFLGPLPYVPPAIKLAVCRHMINDEMEQKVGIYNAGFLWTCDKNLPNNWRLASKTSRFYDQAALEDVVKSYKQQYIHEFPLQNNYGWWRMFYTLIPPHFVQKGWSSYINEPHKTAGIMVNGSALLSIHTHFSEDKEWTCTKHFNNFFMHFISNIESQPKAKALRKFITNEFVSTTKPTQKVE